MGRAPVGRVAAVVVSAALTVGACTRPAADATPVRQTAPTTPTTPAAAPSTTPASPPPASPPPASTPPAMAPASERAAVVALVAQAPPLPPASVPDRTVTMAFTGDILPHSPLWGRAADNARAAGGTGFDFTPMLAGLAPVIGPVDLGVCHLETPIAPAGEALSTMPLYGVPAEIVDAIAAAGYDRCSTASNHAADRGGAGIDRTVAVLEAAGLGQSGMARTPDEIAPHVVDVGGVAIAHLSYTFSYNGLSLPRGEEWRSALIDPIRIVEDARAARALGAEAVIVSLHWGSEGDHAPTRYQRDVAAWLAASDSVDLIVGHHAHVVQPIEQIHGVWVVFGLGNVLSNLPTSSMWPAASQDAMVVTTTLTVTADGSVAFERPVAHPTWVDKEAGWIVRLVQDELARPDLAPAQRARLETSLARTAAVVGPYLPART